MTFEELVEYLGIDEPEIIDYNSGAEFGGLTEEQRKYILSEFINGRPVYIMLSNGGGTRSASPSNRPEALFTDTALILFGPTVGLASQEAQQLAGFEISIILADSNSSIDDGGSYAY